MLDNNINPKLIEKWMNSLTVEEVDALFKYTGEAESQDSYYEKINKHLRGIENNKEIEKYIKHIDSALKKFSLESDITVYRAQGIEDISDEITINDIYETYQYVKEHLVYKNYISTSLKKRAAIFHLNFLFQIKLHKFGMLINANLKANSSCGYLKYLSYYENEEELLVMRNKKFTISEVRILNDNVIELVGNFEELEG